MIPSLSILETGCAFRFALHEAGLWRALDAVGDDISLAELAEALQIPPGDITEDPNIDFFEISSSPIALHLFLKCARNPLPMGEGGQPIETDRVRAAGLEEGPHPPRFARRPLPSGEVRDWALLLAVTVITLPIEGWLPPASHEITTESLAVPPISQREQDPAIARHICSPVNTLMVARYLTGRDIELSPFVAAVHSEKRRMYGIWPRAIAAAAGQGVAGMVTALSGWGEVAGLLQAGLPVVVSVAYQACELAGGAVAATGGHLVTIIGLTESTVIVNDPAASTAAVVRREYGLDEFSRAWLGNKLGICYVLWLPDVRFQKSDVRKI